MVLTQTDLATRCHHCGSECVTAIWEANQPFCCEGCRAVYLLLQESLKCAPLAKQPTLAKRLPDETPYLYLNQTQLLSSLCDYLDNKKAIITLYLPAIHCPSCIWLIEQLPRLATGILSARVNYLKKEVQVCYDPSLVRLSKICALLSSLGYDVELRLDAIEKKTQPSNQNNRNLLLKLGLAGFAFGNIMLFSLPEYFDNNLDWHFKVLFTSLNIALSLPVLFWSASEFFQSAWQAIRQRGINMDVPIALGIIAMFARSIWEIVTGIGPGYMDTFNGLIFLLLLGRYLQRRTHEAIHFNRNYSSFFPLAVTRIDNQEKKELVAIYELKKGDVIWLRHGELLPADAIVLSKNALLDYSFVTGEKDPIERQAGEEVAAGGRVVAQAALFCLKSTVKQSRLTNLWNHSAFNKEEKVDLAALSLRLSPAFTFTILSIAILAALYWYWLRQDLWLAFNAVTGVLIIACPCALAMAAPFSLGNGLNIFSKNGLYLKNSTIIEKLSRIKNIVFDKTGTLTDLKKYQIKYRGIKLSASDRAALKSIFNQSVHPLARALANSIYLQRAPLVLLTHFQEETGKGLVAQWGKSFFLAGSRELLSAANITIPPHLLKHNGSQVFVARDGQLLGVFFLEAKLRTGIENALRQLDKKFTLYLLSGDNEKEKPRLLAIFPQAKAMYFNQTPEDKLAKVAEIQHTSGSVLMVGDGLNDAGALKAAEVGLAVSDDSASFTPACDGIIEANQLKYLLHFLSYAQDVRKTILINFGISFLYNTFGLSYAVQGLISPLFCAILMPLSSITVILTATILTRYYAWRRGLTIWK